MAKSFHEYKSEKEEEELLWHDKKRYLGLPISFTNYSLTKDRLSVKRGFLKTKLDDVLLYRIMDISMDRTFGQKIFGVGTITIHARDKSTPTLKIENIKNVTSFSRYLSDLVEQVREQKRVTGREMYGTGMYGNPDDLDDFDDFDDYDA